MAPSFGQPTLTEKRLGRGAFRDVEELIMAISDYIDTTTGLPSPLFGRPRRPT